MPSPNPFVAPDDHEAAGLLLRSYRPGDGAAIHEGIVESYDLLKPWMPWANVESVVEEVEAKARSFAARYLLAEDFPLTIWKGSEFVGGTGFLLRGGYWHDGNAEIGLWIRSSYAGQGVGTLVLREMLAWGFTQWDWERLIWKCDTRNVASARVAEKCGMVLDGTMRQDMIDVQGNRATTHLYSALRSEFR